MKNPHFWTRRTFLKAGALASVSFAAPGRLQARQKQGSSLFSGESPDMMPPGLDLNPAKYIWYPSGRTLANTFFLFRKKFLLSQRPRATNGWVYVDSRYALFINGVRIQWGPSPADPRTPEADPLDRVWSALVTGENVIAIQALFFGHGEGTWPAGKPGLIFRLELEYADGQSELVVSDESWSCHLPQSWPWGQYKRWYLRALQEEFDARHFPYGWDLPGFTPGIEWLPAMVMDCPPDQSPLASAYPDYQNDSFAAGQTALLPRAVPLLNETWIPALRLVEAHTLFWKQAPKAYFAYLTPNAFEPGETLSLAGEPLRVRLRPDAGIVLTFEWEEQLVGWPGFEIACPEGLTLELLVHEAHDPALKGPMNSHFHSWSRFTGKQGRNRFETFDYESFRWVQLHLHPGEGEAVISNVGARRRVYPFGQIPAIDTGEPALDRLMRACVNTLLNCAQETLVDGMGRERQQYSGDIGHLVHALHLWMNDEALSARFCRTFSQGMTQDGFFLDTWPAYDRLNRLSQRQLHLTPWGPLLDHGVGFVFDCWHQYLYSGSPDTLRQVYPALRRFLRYLAEQSAATGLLEVENIGVAAVWIDNFYPRTRHKQCAFNLYAAAMAIHAFAPLAEALNQEKDQKNAKSWASRLLRSAARKFWDGENWVVNLPWLAEEGQKRCCYRSISTAILFDLFPQNRSQPGVNLLDKMPANVIPAYPANEIWRLWALCKAGKSQTVINDLRNRWATLPSVLQNNTLQEQWEVQPDADSQWSHAPLGPLYILAMGILGFKVRKPGGQAVEIRPRFGDLQRLKAIVFAGQRPFRVDFEKQGAQNRLALQAPQGTTVLLYLPDGRGVEFEGESVWTWEDRD